MAPRVLILVSMCRYLDSDFKFVKHFNLTLLWPSQPPFNKMASVKSNCLYIFKTRYLEGCYTDTFLTYTYIGVDILNFLLLGLERHSHPTSDVFINVAISYQIWHLVSWFWYQCIRTWTANSNSSTILHLTLMLPSQPPFNKMAHVKSNCLHIF